MRNQNNKNMTDEIRLSNTLGKILIAGGTSLVLGWFGVPENLRVIALLIVTGYLVVKELLIDTFLTKP